VAVAGPVANNKAELTNRATWPAIDGKALATAFGIAEVEIINDFVAMGYVHMHALHIDIDIDIHTITLIYPPSRG